MRVLYFARVREIAGTKLEEITSVAGRRLGSGGSDASEPSRGGPHSGGSHRGDPDGLVPGEGGSDGAPEGGPTVSDLLDDLARRHGDEFAALVERSTVMVDDEIVARDRLALTPLGAEVAILPPVSGGDGPHDDGRGGHGHGDPARGGHVHSGHVHSGHRRTLSAAVLTVSDRASVGDYDDLTGPAVAEIVERRLGARIVDSRIVADSRDRIAQVVAGWCDRGGARGEHIDLVITNGGTGLSDRDVTPEALRTVLDVEAPGLGEVMRTAGLAATPLAALSRQLGGRRARTVVIAVPGSVRAATQSLEAVIDILPHLCELAADQTQEGSKWTQR